jgi:hypothetical protein
MALSDVRCRQTRPTTKLQKLSDGGGLQLWIQYRALHDSIIRYPPFWRDKATDQEIEDGLLRAWYCFPEVKQTWLGFSEFGKRPRPAANSFGAAGQVPS